MRLIIFFLFFTTSLNAQIDFSQYIIGSSTWIDETFGGIAIGATYSTTKDYQATISGASATAVTIAASAGNGYENPGFQLTTSNGVAVNRFTRFGSGSNQAFVNTTKESIARVDKVRVPTLSTAADRFFVRFGFDSDITTNAGAGASTISLYYDDATSGGNWTCRTGVSSVYTNTNSGVPVVVNTNYNLRIVTTSTIVRFYIDDVLVATHSTNIPSTSTGVMAYDIKTSLTVTTAGTTRSVLFDTIKFKF